MKLFIMNPKKVLGDTVSANFTVTKAGVRPTSKSQGSHNKLIIVYSNIFI